MAKLDDAAARVQEAQYEFPYHYIPKQSGGKFSATRHWNWGFRYLGGLHVALTQLKKLEPASVIDIGCGDGRFLREVAAALPQTRLMGVDASQRAIQFAAAFNPTIAFETQDITAAALTTDPFDAATLIEVIEHIPPVELSTFLAAVASRIVPGGHIVVTVPHRNKALISKHHQHFTANTLREILSPYFTDIELIPFDVDARRSVRMWMIDKVLGGKGRWMVFTQQRVLNFLYEMYVKQHLFTATERNCERIAAIAKKR